MSPCKYVQILHNNKHFQKQQQLAKNLSRFARVVLRLIFIELKNRCFVYDFTDAKLIGFMTISSKKD